MREAEIQSEILSYLFTIGVFCWRQNNLAAPGRRFTGKKGCPDILGLTPNGTFLGIEVKSEKGKLSPEQKNFQHAIIENNGLYIIATGIKDLLPYLKYFRK